MNPDPQGCFGHDHSCARNQAETAPRIGSRLGDSHITNPQDRYGQTALAGLLVDFVPRTAGLDPARVKC